MIKKYYRKLWDAVVAGSEKKLKKEKLDYLNDIDKISNLQYSNDSQENMLDILMPKNCQGKKMPVIFFTHGGGYISGRKEYFQKFLCNYARQGFVVVNAEYRKVDDKTDFIVSLTDSYNALSYALKYLKTVPQADLDNLIMMGDSSGAHISSLLTCISKNSALKKLYNYNLNYNIKACVFHSPMFEIFRFNKLKMPKQTQQLFLNDNDFNTHQILTSTLRLMDSSFPPTICVSSVMDILRFQTNKFVKACKEKNINLKLISTSSLANCGHDFHIVYMDKKISKKTNMLVVEQMKRLTSNKNQKLDQNEKIDQDQKVNEEQKIDQEQNANVNM